MHKIHQVIRMSEAPFELSPVEKKPGRRYREGSKYDKVVDAFLEMSEPLVAVDVEGRKANYLRVQLKKRIDKRGLKNVSVSVVSNQVYLEK